MRIFFLFTLTVLLLSACGKGRTRIPKNVLGPDSMSVVLWDIMRADQYASNYVLRKDSTLDTLLVRTSFYRQIFDLHHTNKEEFKRSFEFYRSHPDILKRMMDSLSVRVAKQVVDPNIPVPIKDTGVKITPVIPNQ